MEENFDSKNLLNELRREANKLQFLVRINTSSTGGTVLTDDVKASITRLIDLVPSALDEMNGEISSLRAYKKMKEDESEKMKGILYFWIAALTYLLCIGAVLFVFGYAVVWLKSVGVRPGISFISIIILIIAIVRVTQLIKRRKNTNK